MRLTDAHQIISSAIKHNIELSAREEKARDAEYVIPMLWGPPGVGKTTLINDLAVELGIERHTVILAQYDAGELGGFPMLMDSLHGKRMTRARPAWLPDKGTGVLILDEFPQSPLANQNIAAQLINERRVGEHELGSGWTIVTAGNDIKHRAGTNQMPSHVKDRVLHLDIEADANTALDYFNKNTFNPELTGFIRYRPEWLHKFDPDQKACPTPRSWERVNSVLGWGMEASQEQWAIAGLVGAPAAADFSGFLRVFRELPDPDAPLKDPDNAVIPDDPSVLYALMASLSARVEGKTIRNLMKYLDRVPGKEFVACCVRDMLSRNSKLAQHESVSVWLRETGSELLLEI